MCRLGKQPNDYYREFLAATAAILCNLHRQAGTGCQVHPVQYGVGTKGLSQAGCHGDPSPGPADAERSQLKKSRTPDMGHDKSARARCSNDWYQAPPTEPEQEIKVPLLSAASLGRSRAAPPRQLRGLNPRPLEGKNGLRAMGWSTETEFLHPYGVEMAEAVLRALT